MIMALPMPHSTARDTMITTDQQPSPNDEERRAGVNGSAGGTRLMSVTFEE
jgi:hypothetical protein